MVDRPQWNAYTFGNVEAQSCNSFEVREDLLQYWESRPELRYDDADVVGECLDGGTRDFASQSPKDNVNDECKE
jgi:hypothetical protein